MTSTAPAPSGASHQEAAVIERLGRLDRFLPVWIGAAMLAGLALGRLFPGLDDTLDRIKVDTVSLPIAVGLLVRVGCAGDSGMGRSLRDSTKV